MSEWIKCRERLPERNETPDYSARGRIMEKELLIEALRFCADGERRSDGEQ